ncbi:MAG: TerC family protein [Planctomycetes bacterium]|nr:TerC family protein [Planctomycetota bacterium]
MLELLTSENLIALLTLTALEIVLGIDNIIFLSILTGKLPPEQRARGRRIGLAGAMLMRIALLLALTWVMKLTATLFTALDQAISGRDLILIVGGMFLIGKSTWEIHDKLEGHEHGADGKPTHANFASIIVQVMLLDLVFSLDSVITAVGMSKHVEIMITAVVIAVIVMMVFAGAISEFVERRPTIKILALSFLILIGVMLVAEGFDQHVNKGYIYFAMAFSLVVEMLNIRLRRKSLPVELRHTRLD